MKNPIDAPSPDRAEGKLDATQVRLQNERLLLNLIWSERAISRAEIARVTGLSRSTVSAIVEDLLETGLVSFRGAGESQGGRPPVILGFEDDALALVGVDLGASHVSVIVTNLRGEERAWRTRNHTVRPDPEGSLALVDELIGEALYDAGMSDERIVGIGVGVPSPVNPKHPGKVSPLVMPRWRDVDIVARLKAVHSCPVLLDNDANLGALAELWWGKGVGARDLVFIKVGTGIGCGHIIHGDIYRGATGVAGEIGHLTLDPNGPPCVCGLTGCLATYVGTDALLARTREALMSAPYSMLSTDSLDIGTLVDAAYGEDPVALRMIADAGRRLGTAIASLVNLNNPGQVILGGGLMRAGDLLLEPLRDTLRRRTLWLALDDFTIDVGALGERDIAIGAATLVLKGALDEPRLFPRVLRRITVKA